MSEKSSGLTNRGALQAPLNVKRDYQDANQPNTSDILTERDVRSAFLEDILTKEQNTCIEVCSSSMWHCLWFPPFFAYMQRCML